MIDPSPLYHQFDFMIKAREIKKRLKHFHKCQNIKANLFLSINVIGAKWRISSCSGLFCSFCFWLEFLNIMACRKAAKSVKSSFFISISKQSALLISLGLYLSIRSC